MVSLFAVACLFVVVAKFAVVCLCIVVFVSHGLFAYCGVLVF